MATFYTMMDSPVGRLLLAGDGEALTRLSFQTSRRAARPDETWTRSERPFRTAEAQLRAYFDGSLRRFDLPLILAGSEFERQVWGALLGIPYGRTVSYGDLARRIGRPTASRAVGLANGRNPIAIVVPCHRVIGSNGALTGYGGGLEVKRWLLAHEGVLAERSLWDVASPDQGPGGR